MCIRHTGSSQRRGARPGSLKEPSIARSQIWPAGEALPRGSRTATLTPRRWAASTSMRPSWPPPRQPTVRESIAEKPWAEGATQRRSRSRDAGLASPRQLLLFGMPEASGWENPANLKYRLIWDDTVFLLLCFSTHCTTIVQTTFSTPIWGNRPTLIAFNATMSHTGMRYSRRCTLQESLRLANIALRLFTVGHVEKSLLSITWRAASLAFRASPRFAAS